MSRDEMSRDCVCLPHTRSCLEWFKQLRHSERSDMNLFAVRIHE